MINLSRNAQGNRKLLLKINGAGLEKGLESYLKVKDDTAYNAKMKEVIPVMVEETGTVLLNTFTVTGKDLSTANGKYLVSWNPTDFSTTVDKQQYALNIQKITGAVYTTDTELTVANNLPMGYTKAVILDTPYLEVMGISDFSFVPSAADIAANTNATGKAVVNDKGLYTFDITGITGMYGANLIPTQYQLSMGSMPSGAYQYCIATMGTEVGEKYFEGVYSVKEFSDSGANDGSADQALSCNLQYKYGGAYKKIVTANNFMTGTVIEEI